MAIIAIVTETQYFLSPVSNIWQPGAYLYNTFMAVLQKFLIILE